MNEAEITEINNQKKLEVKYTNSTKIYKNNIPYIIFPKINIGENFELHQSSLTKTINVLNFLTKRRSNIIVDEKGWPSIRFKIKSFYFHYTEMYTMYEFPYKFQRCHCVFLGGYYKSGDVDFIWTVRTFKEAVEKLELLFALVE